MGWPENALVWNVLQTDTLVPEEPRCAGHYRKGRRNGQLLSVSLENALDREKSMGSSVFLVWVLSLALTDYLITINLPL